MNTSFSPEEIDTLSAQIDAQLAKLYDHYDPDNARGEGDDPLERLTEQRQAIEQNTGESANTFFKRFVQEAKKDLCTEEGMLYKQWKKWGDLDNAEVIKSFKSVLVALGVTGAVLQTVLVASAVIVIHLGIKTVCEQYNKE